MNKLFAVILSIALIAILAMQKTIAMAGFSDDEGYCKNTVIKKSNPSDKYDWDYSIIKNGPNFVLDYFQDPDQHGVSIDVTINAVDFIADYWKWEDVCTPYEEKQSGMTACKYPGKFAPGFRYAYLTPSCIEQPPEITYRAIETGTISIWLEPTSATRDLLGIGPNIKGTNKPVLRYLYPDQWALVVVLPGERKIIEKPWFRNSADVENFLKENKDFIILDTSVKNYELTSRLPKSQSPINGLGTLALYGFGNNCWADLSGYTGLDGHEVCSFSEEIYKTGYGIKSITIKFDRIPLDVPGEWSIGVSFNQLPAKYDSGRSEEEWNNGLSREFSFSDELMEKRFSFESYIIRSAPCNPEEPGNCWEEEKPAE